MLLGDYFTYETKASQSGGSPNCRLCPSPAPVESLNHILVSCTATSHIRNRIFSELELLLKTIKTPIDFDAIKKEPLVLEQFLIDPTSMNLKNSMRINIVDPSLNLVLKSCRDLCYSLGAERIRKLKSL